jgi:hypothetical protein
MILDTQTQLSDAQAVTSTGDAASTNVYDTGAAADIGIGEELYIYARTKAAFTTSASGTLQFVLQDSADNSSWADVQALTPVRAVAALTANTDQVRARLPIGLRRYIRLAYRVATGAMTAGTVDAYIVLDVQAQQYGASGFSVA